MDYLYRHVGGWVAWYRTLDEALDTARDYGLPEHDDDCDVVRCYGDTSPDAPCEATIEARADMPDDGSVVYGRQARTR